MTWLPGNRVPQLFEPDTGLPENSGVKLKSSYCTEAEGSNTCSQRLLNDSLWQPESFGVFPGLSSCVWLSVFELLPPLGCRGFVLAGAAPVATPFD